jgi:hypothetical protein
MIRPLLASRAQSPRRARAFALAGLATLALIAAVPAWADCARLQALLHDGPEFARQRAAVDPQRGTLGAGTSHAPLGLTRCTMQQVRQAVGITCEGGPQADLATATAQAQILTEQIRTCVGSGWQATAARIGPAPATMFELAERRLSLAAVVMPWIENQQPLPDRYHVALMVAGRPSAAAVGTSGSAPAGSAVADSSGAGSGAAGSATAQSPPLGASPATPPEPPAKVVPRTPDLLPWRTDAKAFCTDLRKVIDNGKDHFAKLRGRERRGGGWIARMDISGTESCDVDSLQAGDAYFNCVAFDSPDAGLRRGALLALRDDVKACLGAGWRQRDRSSAQRSKFVFYHAEVEQTVELWESGLRRIKLDINSRD